MDSMAGKKHKRSGSFSGKRRSLAAAVSAVVLSGVLIEILSYTGHVKNFILPAPSAVFAALFINFREILPHLTETAYICTAGLALSIAFAFLIALTMDRIRIIKEIIYPLIIASQTIPIMVITPVIILLMGFGLAPRLIVVVLVCFFPVTISLYDGFQSTDPDMILLMKSLKATNWQILRHVKLPSAVPAFFSGVRISATYCVMAAVIAEWQGANRGLGVYLLRVRRSYYYDRMFAAILLIVVLSVMFFLIAHFAERKALKWRK